MGKGDQRSRRGKIWRGTFGKRRPKKRRPATPVEPATETPKKKAEKDAEATA